MIVSFYVIARPSVTAISVSPDSNTVIIRYLVSGHSDGHIALWDLERDSLLFRKNHTDSEITDVDINFEFSNIIVATTKNKSVIFLKRNGDLVFSPKRFPLGAPYKMQKAFRTVHISRDGKRIYCMGSDGFGALLDDSGKLINYIYSASSSTAYSTSSRLSMNSRHFITGHYDGTLKVWNTLDDSLTIKYENIIGKGPIIAMDTGLLSMFKLLAFADYYGNILLFDYGNDKIIDKEKGFGVVSALSFSWQENDVNGILTGYTNGNLGYWNLDVTPKWKIKAIDNSPKKIHSGKITDLIVLNKGQIKGGKRSAITAGDDGYIRFVDYTKENYPVSGSLSFDGASWDKEGRFLKQE